MTTSVEPDVPLARKRMLPQRYKVALLNWVSVYPLITLLLWAGEPITRRVPVYVTTLVLSLTLVCLLTFVVSPIMMRLFANWLQPGDEVSHAKANLR